ncbi:MAG: transposase [Moorea sp. SIO3H5]|nr:transposase [Moorena sp. SIO3H5]
MSPVLNDVESLRGEVEQLHQIINQQQVIIDQLSTDNKILKARISQLEKELEAQKKLKGKPKLKASRLNETKPTDKDPDKRRASGKRSKKGGFGVDKPWKIEPENLPKGAKLHQYREYDVQELTIERCNIRFLLGEYILPDGSIVRAQLPPEYQHTGHFGPVLVSYILHEHYQNRVPQPLIREQLNDWGIDISTGQINRILSEGLDEFVTEQSAVLKEGLSTCAYIHTDDTGARHDGKNGYCTVVGNDLFSYFKSSQSKSRVNFLEVLQGGTLSYVLNDESRDYLEMSGLAAKHLSTLSFSSTVLATEHEQWEEYLSSVGICTPNAIRVVTEAALLGGLIESGVSAQLIILSDGAGQFNLLVHALCWIHAERSIRKLEGSTARFRQNIDEVQGLIWDYYQELKAYQLAPSETEKQRLDQRFDEIFGRCYLQHATLSNALLQFRSKKEQLLQVLDAPDIPLHNNQAESDIRERVIRQKISGGTRSQLGRQARDTMVGLKKTCRKLGVSFWEYLLSRVRGDPSIESLAELLKRKAMESKQVAQAT